MQNDINVKTHSINIFFIIVYSLLYTIDPSVLI